MGSIEVRTRKRLRRPRIQHAAESGYTRKATHREDEELQAPPVKNFEFSIVLDGVRALTDEQADALYGCCDDGTESEVDGVVRLDFGRSGRSFTEAVRSALVDVRRCGYRAARVEEEDELVTAAEIAERTRRSRESVRLLIAGKRGPGDFPPPFINGRSHRLWRWTDVERWFATYERRETRLEDHGPAVDAINLILALRRQRTVLRPDERRELARVAREEHSLAVIR